MILENGFYGHYKKYIYLYNVFIESIAGFFFFALGFLCLAE